MKFESIEGFLHITEGTKLMQLSASLVNPVIIEVGSYKGKSSVAILEGMKSGTLHCVDTFDGRTMPDSGYYQLFINNIGNDPRVIVHVGDSITIANSINIKLESVDMLFIDSTHTEEAIIADINAWLKFVKPGGIICFHDYGPFPGIKNGIEKCNLVLNNTFLIFTLYGGYK